MRKAQTLLNSAARWATGLRRGTIIQRLMEATGWMSIKEQVKVATLVQTWKIGHLMKPARLREKMKVTADYQIETQRPRLMFTEDCFRWRAAKQWNDLDLEIQVKRQVLAERTRNPPDSD